MRFKITWKDNKLVLPSGNVDDKVSRLLKDIATRFAPYNSSSEDLIFSELRTSDGFFISPHAAIGDILKDDDYLVAVDFDSWKAEQYKLCKTLFESVNVVNYENDETLSVGVGSNTRNNLYIAVNKGKELIRLELFDYSDLSAFVKDGKQLVALYEKGVNYAKVYFVVANSVVQQVEVEIKVESAGRPEIKLIGLKTANKKIEKGDVTLVQTAYDTTVEENVVFPELVKAGESFPDYDLDYTTTDGGNGGAPESYFNVTSPSGIRFEQVDVIRTEHGWYQNNATSNFYYTDLQITNTTESKVTLTKVSAEYKDKEGTWQPVPAYFGVKNGVYNYNWRWEAVPIPIDARDTFKLSINTKISLPYRFADKMRRSSRHLPDPLEIRIVVVDDKQNSISLPAVYRNKTEYPVLATLKWRQKYVGESDPVVYFQSVDNIHSEARGWVTVVKKLDNYKQINVVLSCNFNGSTTYYFDQRVLNQLAYKAKKEGISKYPVKNYSAKNEDFELQTFAIVNLDKVKTTGFCFELTSQSGGSSTGYFVMPSLN
ncbi:hypothetical protein DFA_07988 [Cavenderia fasciculata]|uniref:Uncharacterized protein n=1 Tax=Cavenderia fasciculata TaxID=261658 RepID=F4Q4E5_CACFS|nr:uncharacterized protein DFA_07988 [Cavenderia fasciculata]EGG17007.1 hypothetical protein DFA_07988 [Cavenderia fasciculata]|eukprot:XP_004355491.1 hypothetical protein DFA_07988 [Cavenderia fasciculata]